MLPSTFNDLLALLLMCMVIPGLWILDGLGIIAMPAEVTGALILSFGLIAQFYFRRGKPEEVVEAEQRHDIQRIRAKAEAEHTLAEAKAITSETKRMEKE
jgi:hypothetical protein